MNWPAPPKERAAFDKQVTVRMEAVATMQTVLASVVTAFGVATASAQEKPIELAPGAGREIVEKYCSSCHSLDYLTMHSSILDDQGWTSEVNKMIDVFGARIGPAEIQIIVHYLIKNYGAGGEVRSRENR
jgi:mono/diheme cytochrome c family protein